MASQSEFPLELLIKQKLKVTSSHALWFQKQPVGVEVGVAVGVIVGVALGKFGKLFYRIVRSS